MAQLTGGISSVSSHRQNSIWPRTMYTIPCSCVKVYKGETCRPLKIRLEKHRKAVVRGEIEKLGMTDHIWKEKGNHLTLLKLLMNLSLIGIILRWGFLIWELIFIYCGLFPLILVVFVLFLLSLRFGHISPLAFFRWFTATLDRNAESCNRIPSNYCLIPSTISIKIYKIKERTLEVFSESNAFCCSPTRSEINVDIMAVEAQRL